MIDVSVSRGIVGLGLFMKSNQVLGATAAGAVTFLPTPLTMKLRTSPNSRLKLVKLRARERQGSKHRISEYWTNLFPLATQTYNQILF